MKNNQYFKLSRWCKIYTRDGTIALYNSLTLSLVFLPSIFFPQLMRLKNSTISQSEIIAILGKENFEKLFAENLIVADNFDNLNFLEKIRSKFENEIGLSIMYLLVTDNCNLRCQYCFEDAADTVGRHTPILMPENLAIKSVDYFVNLVGRYGKKDGEKIIHLYGGEPLLNPQAVKAVILHVDKLKKTGFISDDYKIAVVTNGTLLTEELAELFANHGVTVGLSLDGPEKITNKYRLAKKEKTDVFSEVVKAYRLLIKHGVPMGFSVTLTPDSLENFDRIISFFVDDLGVSDGLCFNILHYNPKLNVGDDYFQKAADFLIKSFIYFRDKGVYEERMMRKATAFAYKRVIFTDCGVNGGQIVVAPDGRVGVCHDFVKPRSYFGDSIAVNYNFDPFAQGLFREWRKRSPLFMEKCYDCEAIGICGGGCPASVEIKTGNRWNVDSRICPHSKKTLEWLIWDVFAKTMEQPSFR